MSTLATCCAAELGSVPVPPSELRATFIVRLWRARAAVSGQWRGEIEHVQSEQVWCGADAVQLLSHIHAHLANMESYDGKHDTQQHGPQHDEA